MPALNQISQNQLLRRIGTPDCPVIIDVTIDADFDQDPYLIPSAKRYPFTQIEELVPSLQGKNVVLICQKGLKLSTGAAAILRSHGVKAENLEGGNLAWRDAGHMRIPNKIIPWNGGKTIWVTRHRPKIDRIACPWLIRRFIDPNAQFLFVAPADAEAVAEKFEGNCFDVENTYWSHRNDKCTFETMSDEFELNSTPLKHLGKIIRGADTDNLDLTPQSAGLSAASLGLSRMYKSDDEQLGAGMLLYDAFFRWARDATNESHDWPTNGAKK